MYSPLISGHAAALSIASVMSLRAWLSTPPMPSSSLMALSSVRSVICPDSFTTSTEPSLTDVAGCDDEHAAAAIRLHTPITVITNNVSNRPVTVARVYLRKSFIMSAKVQKKCCLDDKNPLFICSRAKKLALIIPSFKINS